MPMNQQNLGDVHQLCLAVQKLCGEVNAEREAWGRELDGMFPSDKPHNPYTPPGSPTTGQLRRTSMDLTRALAQLRKS